MKKIISLITAFCMSAASLSVPVFSADAVSWHTEPVRDFCQNVPGTYVETDNGEHYQWLLDLGDMLFQKKTFENYGGSILYLSDYFKVSPIGYDSETSRTYTSGNDWFLYTRCSEISLTVSNESTEIVNEYIKADETLCSYYEDIIVNSRLFKGSSSSVCTFRIPIYGNDGYDVARKIKQEVQEIADVEQFKFTPVVEYYSKIIPFLLTYCPNVPAFNNGYGIDGVSLEQIRETLENYVSENNLDYTVELFTDYMGRHTDVFDYYYGYQLVPNGDVSFDEQVELSKQIYADLDYPVWNIYDKHEDSSGTGSYYSESIDMCNNIDGDANCDGEYTIADATAILQSLGNPDKYGLSLQGEFNADIYNVGDGVTPADALEVQKAMAKYE